MALVLYRPQFWLALLFGALLLAFIAYRWRLRWLPAWLLRLLLLGVILFIIFTPDGALFREALPARQVLLVDQSDSVAQEVRFDSRRLAAQWQASGANRLVVTFGRNVETVDDASRGWPEIDGRATDMEGAVQLARALLRGAPGQVTLASDGIVADAGAMSAAVDALAADGHHLDVIPLAPEHDPRDVVAETLWAPSLLWEGGSFTAILAVQTPTAQTVTVRLGVNNVLQLEEEHVLQAGTNTLPLTVESPALGILNLRAIVGAEDDPRRANNQVYATARVFEAPRVLFVTEAPGEDSFLVRQLRQSGVEVDAVAPEGFRTELDRLLEYRVIFLNNLLAQALAPEQMLALRVFVEDHGGGLVFLGGLNSYTLGGYKNTPLAPLLPVKLEPPPRLDRPPTTFVIIFDRSSSMDEPQPEIPAITLAREAAVRAIEIVDREDFIGVMTYATDARWDVPLSAASGGLILRRAQDTISQIQAGGGTALFLALSTAIGDLERQQPTASGLILLLSDGRSMPGHAMNIEELVFRARQLGLSISTILLGEDESAAELMERIASEGNGRYHQVLNASELPRIMVEEGQAARGDNVQEGITGLVAGESGHPVLAGINPARLPVLRGYNALTSRGAQVAEDILLSASFGDPILSGWQVGLGRVVAWMGDAGDNWAASWQAWEGSGPFWAQVVRYALLNPSLGPARVDVRADAAQLDVDVRLSDRLGQPYNWAQPRFVYAVDDAEAQVLAIPQTAPGAYEVTAEAPEPGAYRALVGYQYDGDYREVPAAFAVNYPVEWRMPNADQGHRNLATWAAMTGGAQVSLESLAQVEVDPEPLLEVDTLLWFLMLGLIVSWPIEIAVRRRWLPWMS